MSKTCARILFVFVAVAIPAVALAQSSVEQQIKDTIFQANEHAKKNKVDLPNTYSKDGSLEFWSSGGLLQEVPAQAPATQYDAFNLNPKHIRVVQLADNVAVAMYYSEGSFKFKDGGEVSHYMTRALQVFVKEGNAWKVRAAHWSPVAAGSGTKETATPID